MNLRDNLRIRNKGEDVNLLHKYLWALSFELSDEDAEVKDNRFGKNTRTRLQEFQMAHHLKTSGTVDLATMSKLHQQVFEVTDREQIVGTLLFPEELQTVEGTKITVYEDKDCREEIGRAISDVHGRFVVKYLDKKRHRRDRIWVQWEFDETLQDAVPIETEQSILLPIFVLNLPEHERHSQVGSHLSQASMHESLFGRINNVQLLMRLDQQLQNTQGDEDAHVARWTRDNWQELLLDVPESIPEDFRPSKSMSPEESLKEAIKNYAGYLKLTFEHLYPAEAIRIHLKRQLDNGQHKFYSSWIDSVALLLDDKNANLADPINKLEQKYPGVFNEATVRQGLLTFQRLYRLTGCADAVPLLIDKNYDSALSISQVDPKRFVEQFSEAFGQNGIDAKQVHERARRTTAMAKIVYSNLSDAFNDAPLATLKINQSLKQLSSGDSNSKLLAALMQRELDDEGSIDERKQFAKENNLPDWRELFGSEDLGFCDCVHCKSIFGPAAYLFDMLLFLERFDVTSLARHKPKSVSTALDFLNYAEDPEDIANCVPDDPYYGAGSKRAYGVKKSVAEAILDKRKELGGRFKTLEDVRAIDDKDLDGVARGVGHDTIHDIIHASWGDAGPLAAKLALEFINSASAREIHETIKDDPGFLRAGEKAKGIISEEVARRLVSVRNDQPDERFVSLAQIDNEVRGIGPDTLHDIISTFYSEAFEALYHYKSLLDKFRLRRPDVTSLLLSCENANIEVPHIDLVNELLSDLIDEQKCFGLLPSTKVRIQRNSSGTSEERRAFPQYEPSKETIEKLASALHPWTLPYDYQHDKAKQARHSLNANENDLISVLWQFWAHKNEIDVDSDTIKNLANHILGLNASEHDLIIEPKTDDIETVWGQEIAFAISEDRFPSLADIQRVSGLDYYELEDIIETQFVRTPEDYSIKIVPPDANPRNCDPESLTLHVEKGFQHDPRIKRIVQVLDRIHRFERLRRATDWTTHQLDVLITALNNTVEEETVIIAGLLVYLQRRLNLNADEVLNLFINAPANKPFVLRPDKYVLSAFEQLFGVQPFTLPQYKDKSDSEKQQAITALLASITQCTGVGIDEVQFVFTSKYVHYKGKSLLGAEEIFELDEDEQQNAWEAAVASVFRVTKFVESLDVTLADFTNLIKLTEIKPLPSDTDINRIDVKQVLNCISFVEAAHDVDTWPVKMDELLYIISDDETAKDIYAPSAETAGKLIQRIYSDLHRLSASQKIDDEQRDNTVDLENLFDSCVVEAIADTWTLDHSMTRLLLKQLLENPQDPGSKLIRAFVKNNEPTPELDNSIIKATYKSNEQEREQIETSLQFDWVETPPPDVIDPQAFEVEILINNVQEIIESDGLIKPLTVVSTGTVVVKLNDKDVITFEGTGQIQSNTWDTDDVKRILDGLGGAELSLSVKFMSPRNAAGDPISAPLILRVLQEIDPIRSPLRVNRLENAIIHFDKATRVIKGLGFSKSIWVLLTSETLSISLSSPDYELWTKLIIFQRLSIRDKSADKIQILDSLIGGIQISEEMLAQGLGLSILELKQLLMMLVKDHQKEVVGGEDEKIWICTRLYVYLKLSDLARKLGLPLDAVIEWVSAPAENMYQWVIGAIGASNPQDQWLDVLQTINDPVRENLRDAMINWLLTHPRKGESGEKLSPFSRPEYISDHLLTDVQMTACLMTSRVQFAYAAVQKFIDALRLGFEEGLAIDDAESQERFEQEWEWRRFYRLWEANRRVFVNPENWLEPDLRPDKSQFFAEFEEELLQGPLTTDSAEDALINYLSKVVAVSRPEIVGVVHARDLADSTSPVGFRDPELLGTHVFARSRDQPYQLYYRRRMPAPDNRWMPWERIEAEIPGTHYVPFIANRRLYLVVAEFGIGRTKPQPCDCDHPQNVKDPKRDAHIILSTLERRHGKWSQVRQSEPISFDPNDVELRKEDTDNTSDFPHSEFEDLKTYGKVQEINFQFKIEKDENIEPDSKLYAAIEASEPITDILLKPKTDNEWKGFKSLRRDISAYRIVPSEIRGIWLELRDSGSDDVPFNYVKAVVTTEDVEDGRSKTQIRDLGSAELNDESNQGKQFLPLETPFEDRVHSTREANPSSDFRTQIAEASPLPPELFSLHVEVPSSDSIDPIRIHVRVHNEVEICREVRRQFKFTGNLDPEIADGWPTDWVDGSRKICITQKSVGSYLTYIEIFPDGKVIAPLPPKSHRGDEPERGRYPVSNPYGQLFMSTLKQYFVADQATSLIPPRAFQVCVPSVGNITSQIQPKFLDEASKDLQGITLFISDGKTDILNPINKPPSIETFSHLQSTGFLGLLYAHGVPELMHIDTQTLSNSKLRGFLERVKYFDGYYSYNIDPDDFPTGDVDFSDTGSYSDYNWELFFHAPLLIGQRLSEAGQHEEADRWFRLLFDPAKGRLGQTPLEAFQTRPLRNSLNERLEDMLNLLEDNKTRNNFAAQVDRLNRFPYQPHLIARSRVSAYQKMLVMKYLDHLISWADDLFRRAYATDNRTELENASSRYDLAVKLLGERPEVLPLGETEPKKRSYDEIVKFRAIDEDSALDYWNPKIRAIENNLIQLPQLPAISLPQSKVLQAELANQGEGIPDLLYFCIPHNDKLLEYWDTLAERLANLRSCRDIEGIQRTLSLYGRRIDPGLLVRAGALGIDIDVVLGYIATSTPKYRFRVLVQRAKDAASRAQAFGQALLTALEKGDAEELAKLRSKFELSLLKEAKNARDEQVREAKEALEALWLSRESAEIRYEFFASREKINKQEMKEGILLNEASKSDEQAASESSLAAILGLLPNVTLSAAVVTQYPPSGPTSPRVYFSGNAGVSAEIGGRTFANIWQQKASKATYEAGQFRSDANKLARQAQFTRRWEDWRHQSALAEKEIEQIDRQILSAEIRLRIAEIEQENHLLQIDHATTVDAYLRDKFTNAKLYRWMESRMSRLYYQQYRLAYELAQKALFAMRFEHGLDTESGDLLLPDTWDTSRRGMGAADDLVHELEKMESENLSLWQREHDKQKELSVAHRWPDKFIDLILNGKCTIEICEHHLDEDEPGDYFRRLEQVAVTIPCVRGPGVSVNARLTLTESYIRIKRYTNGDPYLKPNPDHMRNLSLYGKPHIVTSKAVNDTGLFNNDLNSPTFLPFEGLGVVGTWEIELDHSTNHFDRSTVPDVKLDIMYTSRDGGENSKKDARNARITEVLPDSDKIVLLRIPDQFAREWAEFRSSTNDKKQLSLEVTNDHLPDHIVNNNNRISSIEISLLQDKKWSKDKNKDKRVEVENRHEFENPTFSDDEMLKNGISYIRLKTNKPMFTIQLTDDSPIPICGWLLVTLSKQ